MNPMEVKIDDLPMLAFEKILSYLSLKDRIRARAVSRRWCKTIDSYKVKSLCFSERSNGFIPRRSRLVSGAFAKNSIGSFGFKCFFNTFRDSILSNLKHLRLCDLCLNKKDRKAVARRLNSFGQLEKLDIIRFSWRREVELNLPMLNSIHLEGVFRIRKLTLDAPRLKEVKQLDCAFMYGVSLQLDLVHVESVEKLITDDLHSLEVNSLKNLKYLFIGQDSEVDSTLLSGLEHLKEIHLLGAQRADDLHLMNKKSILELFQQKQQHNRFDLKIYLCGLLLNSGPDDPAILCFSSNSLAPYFFSKKAFDCLAENSSRLADEIPFCASLNYTVVEAVVPGSEIDLLKRFTSLNSIIVSSPVQDIERFLGILEKLDNILSLSFKSDQLQGLLDRLLEHCDLQCLTIYKAVSDFGFLWRFKSLNYIELVHLEIDIESVRKVLEELEFLTAFKFWYLNTPVTIRIKLPKRFETMVWTSDVRPYTLKHLSDVIQLIIEKTRQND